MKEKTELIPFLVEIYFKTSQIIEIEKYQVQLVETIKKLKGPKHRDTLESKIYLAHIYIEQEWLTNAEELLLQLLEAANRVLGQYHPQILSIMAVLAEIYCH